MKTLFLMAAAFFSVLGTTAQITAGGSHTCALFDNHKIKCWGYNEFGELGLGDKQYHGDSPEEVGDNLSFTDLDLPVKSLTVGKHHNCTELINGGLKCWGYNQLGQLGQEHGQNIGNDPGEMGHNIDFTDLGSEFLSRHTPVRNP